MGGALFPIGLGLLSVFVGLWLLAAWSTVVALVGVVLVVLAASGVIMFWLGHLLSDRFTDAVLCAAELDPSALPTRRMEKRPMAVVLGH